LVLPSTLLLRRLQSMCGTWQSPNCLAYPLHLAIIALFQSAIKENTYSIKQSLERQYEFFSARVQIGSVGMRRYFDSQLWRIQMVAFPRQYAAKPTYAPGKFFEEIRRARLLLKRTNSWTRQSNSYKTPRRKRLKS
jgi:hypothetical protein